MIKNRNKLYFFLLTACIFGYVWLLYNYSDYGLNNGITACYFKNITTLPCPSCGSTRSVISIFEGNFIEAFLINPLGFVVSAIILILPFWIFFDFIFKKNSLFEFYKSFEKKLCLPKIYIPLLILVLINWIWNLNKEL